MSCVEEPVYHNADLDWRTTPEGVPRGYIQPGELRELWFHTGTACNLHCSFCLEGSKPGDTRLDQITFEDVKPFIDRALTMGTEQFSFTGGEPLVNRDIIRILDYALDHRPCLVLTNATKPLDKRFNKIKALLDKPHPLRFRVSLDHPDPERHDGERGAGNFALALSNLARLHRHGFGVSIARLGLKGEDADAVNRAYAPWLEEAGLPQDIHFVIFPDFYPPGSHPGGLPHITQNCMTTYHDEASRARFMCHFSKMIVKKSGRMRIYACTLVDDDDDYDLGEDLRESQRVRIMLRHHRCFSCFAHGASCSE